MPIHKQRPQPRVSIVFEKTINGKASSLSVVRTSGGIGFTLKDRAFDTPSAPRSREVHHRS